MQHFLIDPERSQRDTHGKIIFQADAETMKKFLRLKGPFLNTQVVPPLATREVTKKPAPKKSEKE